LEEDEALNQGCSRRRPERVRAPKKKDQNLTKHRETFQGNPSQSKQYTAKDKRKNPKESKGDSRKESTKKHLHQRRQHQLRIDKHKPRCPV
jgi:hypothetical protein